MKRNRRWMGLLVAMLVFGIILTGCMAGNEEASGDGNSGSDSEGDLEDKVVVYSPHGKDILSEFEKQFEAEYDVDMEFLDLGSQEILDRVRSEKNNTQADIWWGAPQVMFDEAKADELLQKYEPTYADSLDDMYHDEEWYWTGTSQTPEVILYNNKEISEEEAPKDWDDLVDPKWEDELIIRYPLASGTMRTIYSSIIYKDFKESDSPDAGYEWLQKLDENTKEYAANPEIMYNQVAKGVGNLSVWNMPDTVMLAEEKGYPFSYVIPESGTPVLTEGIAIVEDAPHPEAAKAFYEFVNSEEAAKLLAEKYYRIPTRDDISDLPKWIEDTQINAMEIDWEVFQEKSEEWMEYWDNNIKNSDKQKEE